MVNLVEYEFLGFNPDYEIRNFVDNVIERLRSSAPSNSAMQLMMSSGKGIVRASCRIASQAGTFVAEVAGDSPIHAIQKIESKIIHQLNVWKGSRFSKEQPIISNRMRLVN